MLVLTRRPIWLLLRTPASSGFADDEELRLPDTFPQLASVLGAGRRRMSRARCFSGDGRPLLPYVFAVHCADGWPLSSDAEKNSIRACPPRSSWPTTKPSCARA